MSARPPRAMILAGCSGWHYRDWKALPTSMTNVIEFRHESWFDETVYDILRKRGAGF